MGQARIGDYEKSKIDKALLGSAQQEVRSLQQTVTELREKVAELEDQIRLLTRTRKRKSAERVTQDETVTRLTRREKRQKTETQHVKDELADIVKWAAGKIRKRQPSLTSGKGVDLRPSSVHGLGVWAVDGFRKGDTILQYEGKVIDKKESDRLEKVYVAETPCIYFYTKTNGEVVDATLQLNLARYVNEASPSVAPNGYTGD